MCFWESFEPYRKIDTAKDQKSELRSPFSIDSFAEDLWTVTSRRFFFRISTTG
jgi:hypothetical protein